MRPNKATSNRRFSLWFCWLLVAALSSSWASVVWAQQYQQYPMTPPGGAPPGYYGYPPYGAGQPPTPYAGAPAYNPNPSSYLMFPPQSRYFQGMLMPSAPAQPDGSFYGPQQVPPGFSRSSQRSCASVTPQAPPPSAIRPPSGTTPVQRPWLGMERTPGVQEVMQPLPGSSTSPLPMDGYLPWLTKQMEERKAQSKNEEPGPGKNQEPTSSSFPYAPEPFSSIEASLNLPVLSGEPAPELRQFGYSVFANPISTFAPVEDIPVGPDYIVGPGDDMLVRTWGTMDYAFFQTVDRNGEINLPNVGPVRVWGLTFKDAAGLIRQQLSRYYRGIESNVTMGRLRIIRVYVVGEVCQPGSYTLSSLSSVTNALFAAGGPLKLGSLRNVQLMRNHQGVVGTIDLYDFLLKGDKTRDVRLESGDTIFVPPIGSVAAMSGEVKRPAIYELTGTVRVSDLIEMAGGKTPRSYLKRVQVVRIKPNAEREVVDLDLSDISQNGGSPMDLVLRDGDLVKVYPTDPRIYNTVTLAGAVKHPGEYEVKSGMRVSQLISRQNVLPEAYVDRVEIARLKDDLTTEVLQVNLKHAWNGVDTQDISLRPRDQITVRSEYRAPWNVTLRGEVKRPGSYSVQRGERLSSVLRRAGGLTDKAFLKGSIFTRRSVQEAEKKMLDEFVRDQDQRMLAQASQLTASASGPSSKEEATANQAVLGQRRELLLNLASRITLGRIVVQLDEPDKLEGTPNDLVLSDGDMLMVPQQPAEVIVMGSVRNPTAVLHKDNVDLEHYLNRAGGVTPEAESKGIYILKADGSAITGFLRLRNIDPGDVVIVPPSTEAKIQWLPLLRDLATIAGQAALGLAGLAAIF